MNRKYQTNRSTEAPMDFEWTNRPGGPPIWSNRGEDPNTPRKHPVDEAPQSILGTPQTPVFSSNRSHNTPFIFQSPQPPSTSQSNPSNSWAPELTKLSQQEESKDVDMGESSPLKVDTDSDEKENERHTATGILRRVHNRRRENMTSKSSRSRQKLADEDEGFDSGSDMDDHVAPITRNTANHYTLNMPAPAPAPSHTPYVLLGYLQFFFNLSLVLLFLYLTLQFIITIQRDVQHRISEYSQDIVQEIAMCSLQYKNNLCEINAVPAMIQQCAKWEMCMNRDPAVVGRAKISAELIAEVVNGFVEPISWKTLIFTLSSLAFMTIFVNALLSLYRTRHQPINTAPPPGQPYSIAPGAPFAPPYPTYLPPAPNTWSHVQPDDNVEASSRRHKLEGGNTEKIT